MELNTEAFARVVADTHWSFQNRMHWGFYFTNESKEPLVIAAKTLGLFGYRFVDLSQDQQKERWWLHLDRVEIHTVETISTRDIQLARFGDLAGFSTYVGWDVAAE